MMRMYETELTMLRWVARRKKGVLVNDALLQFNVVRQVAYNRLSRLFETGHLLRKLEPGARARQRHRYFISPSGAETLKLRWRKKSLRIVVAV